MHNDQIPFRPIEGKAVGAQRGLAAALSRLVKTHNNLEVRPPLKLEAENGNWVLSADPAFGSGTGGGGTTGHTGTLTVLTGVELNSNGIVFSRATLNVADGLIVGVSQAATVALATEEYNNV